MPIETQAQLDRAIDFLEVSAILLLETIEIRELQLDNEHRPDRARRLRAQINTLKAQLGVAMSHLNALEELGTGARLTGPSDEAVEEVLALSEQVAAETNAARRAELLFSAVNRVIQLAGEVRELTEA